MRTRPGQRNVPPAGEFTFGPPAPSLPVLPAAPCREGKAMAACDERKEEVT